MPKKRFFISLILMTSPFIIIGQNQGNIWYFGNNAGLDFNSGTPIALTNGALSTLEGCATIADSAGNLLFYTDGSIVYNSTHVAMPNGTGLLGNNSSTQSAIILQKPGSNTIYYVFTVDDQAGLDGLRYSEVDISLQGGLGNVNANKNIPIVTPTCEKVTVITHQNGNDFWLITHLYNSNTFHSYLITSAGINMTPVVTNLGTIINTGSSGLNTIGYLKASRDGTRIAMANRSIGNVELFDFNKTTGVLSNVMTFTGFAFQSPYGVEFSPNNNILYVSEEGSLWVGTANVFQYNLLAGNQTAIEATKTSIASSTKVGGALQLGPDNKIYYAQYDSSFLSVINNPNVVGAGCNFTANSVSLSGQICKLGLPTFFNSIFVVPGFAYENICFGDSTIFHIDSTANTINSALWNFDDPSSGLNNTSNHVNPSHIFTDTGTYNVTLITDINGYIDTIVKQVVIHSLPDVDLGNDTTICQGLTLALDATTAGGTYIWQDSSTNAGFIVNQPGNYWVELTSSQGCINRDSIKVFYKDPLSAISLGNDTILCGNSNYTLDLSAIDSVTYLWSDNSTNAVLTISSPGIYWGEVINECGTSRDSVEVMYENVPIISLGNDTSLCEGELLVLNANWQSPTTTYLWNTTHTSSAISVSGSGIYSVDVTNICGIDNDDIEVTFIAPPPAFNLGADTMLCDGESTILTTGFSEYDHIWQDQSTATDFIITQAGTYWVTISNECGMTIDTFFATYTAPAILELGENQVLCEGESYNIDITWPEASYLWSDLETSPTRTITQSGVYTVDLFHLCGNLNDQISIEVVPVPQAVDLGPDLILCEGDSFWLSTNQSGFNYLWQDGSILPEVEVLRGGRYELTVWNECAEQSDDVYIDYLKAPVGPFFGMDTSMCEKHEIVLDVSNDQNVIYRWQDGSTESVFRVTEPGLYSVEIENICGIDQDEIQIDPYICFCSIYAPTGFTPNGDGFNDLFSLQYDCSVLSISLKVFNRWGKLVFATNNPDDAWDGTYNGELSPEGVYVWFFDYEFQDANRVRRTIDKGSVTLFR